MPRVLTGLFMDLRNPPQWRQPWDRHYATALERVEEAERRGLGAVWLSEHHLFEDGYLPQPLTFAAAVAARTRTMRIGTAILQAPMRPAADIAEQAAIVDIISAGRLELGLGAGYRVPEWDLYGLDVTRRFELLGDRAREVRRMWRDAVTTPPPLQARPPIWVGGEGPRAARLAGRLGEGLLALKPDLLAPYRAGLEAHGHDPDSARMGGCANLILSEDPERAWALIAPHLTYQWQSYENYAAEGRRHKPAQVTADGLRSTSGAPLLPAFDVVTPEAALSRLVPWLSALPVTHVYFWDSIAGMPEELSRRHIELLGDIVAPALARL